MRYLGTSVGIVVELVVIVEFVAEREKMQSTTMHSQTVGTFESDANRSIGDWLASKNDTHEREQSGHWKYLMSVCR